MAKKKYICAGCNKCTEPCTVELSGDADMTKDPAKMLHCGTWVEVPAEENTNKEQLPKLTTEVFSMEECPEWAQYAAVDPDGEAYWYDGKPRIFGKAWDNESGYRARLIGPHYDASDWKNSTIARLPKLTADVFSFSDCPEWAQYAAVDAEGIAYWYDAKPKLGSQAWCNASEHFVARQITLANIPIRYDRANWRSSLIERPVKEQRPKLTHEVFSMEECPEWAQFAAVDADGIAYWYEDRPEHDTYRWGSTGVQFMKIARGNTKLFYDSSDWKNSLIKRRKKLTEAIFNYPECPDDAVVAVVNDDGTAAWGTCVDIEPIGGGFRSKKPWDCYWTHIPGGACFDATDWQNSPVRRLRKLTEEIFDHPKCPADAVVAVVNASGTAAWGNCADIVCDGSCAFHTDHGNETWTYIPGGACFDTADWQHSAVYRAGVQPKSPEPEVPKLTYDVFSCSTLNEWTYVIRSQVEHGKTYARCPEWARYAAVDQSGAVCVYDTKPVLRRTDWYPDSGGRCAVVCTKEKWAVRFDTTDWKNSLIERPESERPPKLTPDVFSCSNLNEWTYAVRSIEESCRIYDIGCPEWAQYAAVNKSGAVYVYENKPVPLYTVWTDSGGRYAVVRTPDRQELKFDASDWRSSLIERPVKVQLPKLAVDVFSMSECPTWAQYAAVDANGAAYWYDEKPMHGACTWGGPGMHFARQIVRADTELRYDSSDWQHSLIERPAVAPKLTQDVFSAKECPEWARYASVDENGFAYWYEMQPRLSMSSRCWFCSSLRSQMMYQPDRTSAIIFDSTDWMHSLIERQPVAPRQKLTAEVFSMKECPYWAKYAAVDANGLAYWYDAVPCRSTGGLRWNNGGQRATKICYAGEVATPLFDATDWEHSLIKRPAAVPGWFKPGVLAYNNDTDTFFHVTADTEYCEKYLEARVRPFNDAELERKLGQSVLGIFNSRLLVTGFRPKGIASDLPEICVLGTKWITAEELLTYGSKPQGVEQYRGRDGSWIDCGLSS